MIHLPFPDFVTSFANQTGYSAQTLLLGFQRVWKNLTRNAFYELIKQEVPDLLDRAPVDTWINAGLPTQHREKLAPDCPVKRLLLVTASTVPSASFQDILVSLILPIHILVRPAQNLVPITQALIDHLKTFAPELGNRVSICDVGHDDDALTQIIARCDAINVSGSDETIEHYRRLIPQNQRIRVISHGHRISAAAVMHDDLPQMTHDDFQNLAMDLSIWDATGCLSPKAIFIQGTKADALTFSKKLIVALDEVALSLPECAPDMSTLAQINSMLRLAMIDGAAILKAQKNHDTIVVFEPNTAISPLLFPRITSVYCVSSPMESARQFAPRGQAFGMKSMPSDAVVQKLSPAGYNYFCPFGQMQDPPIWWKHDAIGTLQPLMASPKTFLPEHSNFAVTNDESRALL